MKLTLHFLLWSLVFLQGTIQSFDLPTYSYKVGIPLIIIILYVLTNRKNGFVYPQIKYVISLLLISLFSFLINSSVSIFNFIYFTVYIILPYVYFIIVLNEPNEIIINKIKQIVIFYVLFQIPVSLYRFILYGQHESNSGTLTISDGSVPAIFPAIVCAYVFSLYIFRKRKVYILIIIGFLLFGLIGEKRAVTIFIPLVILLIQLINLKMNRKVNTVKLFTSTSFVIIFALLVFYSAVRLNPTLNREGKIGGSFDYQYFSDYASNYNEIGKHDRSSEMQRIEGLIYFNAYMINQPILNLIFGDGAGKLISSKYSKNSSENLMLEYYNVRYGGRMGYVWILMQIGFLGVFVYLSFIISFAKFVWKNFEFKSNYVAFTAIGAVILLDMLFYSTVSIKYLYTMGLYLFLYALILRDKNNKIVINL